MRYSFGCRLYTAPFGPDYHPEDAPHFKISVTVFTGCSLDVQNESRVHCLHRLKRQILRFSVGFIEKIGENLINTTRFGMTTFGRRLYCRLTVRLKTRAIFLELIVLLAVLNEKLPTI